MTHAFFKALLFLGAGSVIIAMHHEQDIRNMGGLKKYLPITYTCMLIATFAIVGFPFLSGFYSKDTIIEAVKLSTLPAAPFAYFCVLAGVFVTSLYSFRLLFVVFHGKERMSLEAKKHLHEPPAVVWGPLVALAIPSVVIGAIFIGPVLNHFFKEAIVVLPQHNAMSELSQHFHGAVAMGLHGFSSIPFMLLVAGAIIAWIGYIQFVDLPSKVAKLIKPIYLVLMNKYGFDAFNQWVIVKGVRSLSNFSFEIGDKKIIDGALVNGTANNIGRFAQVARHIQSGYLYHYIFAMIIGFLGLLLLWKVICSPF
jgi:NADH-quinone oxidoreductase subunit L